MQRPHRRHGADAAGHLLPVPQLIGGASGRRLALPPSPGQNTRAPVRYRLAAQAMQTPAIVAVAVLLSLAGATGVTLLLRPAQVAAPEPNGVSAEEFRAAVHRLDEALQRLQLDLASRGITANPGAERAAVPTLGDEQIDAAMQRYMLQRARGLTADAGDYKAFEPPAVDLQAAFTELHGKGSNFWNNPDAWRRIFAAGKMDELVKLFEANAKANPDDPGAHMDLANAYVAWLQMDQSKGPTLGMKVDGVYDRVLELDDNHWQARFSKAVGYTFWPPFLGKNKDALAQFDRLVNQQDNMPVQPEQAQTYVFYGNLLEQGGNAQKARDIWQRGLARHPDNAELRRRLGQ